MRLTEPECAARLRAESHGVLCTVHPDRGPDPLPVVYAVSDDGQWVGVPIDSVKPKRSGRLQREANLRGDPRAALLTERWDPADWSRLWWVRAHVRFVEDDAASRHLADLLAASVPQYAERPFHSVLTFRITELGGWSAA